MGHMREDLLHMVLFVLSITVENLQRRNQHIEPNITWNQTGPCSGIMDGDNGIGYWVATKATEKAIEMAKENGVAIVGMANVSHTGAIGYYTEMCAKEGLAAITFCQSDPMAVPYGGTEPYYGTNPIHLLARQQTIVMLYLIWLQQFRLGENPGQEITGC